MENDGNDGVPQGENSIREERHGNKHFLINCIQDPITKRVSLVENEIDVNQIPPYDDPSYYLCFRNKRHSSRPIYANQGTPFLSPYTQHQKGKITKSFFLRKPPVKWNKTGSRAFMTTSIFDRDPNGICMPSNTTVPKRPFFSIGRQSIQQKKQQSAAQTEIARKTNMIRLQQIKNQIVKEETDTQIIEESLHSDISNQTFTELCLNKDAKPNGRRYSDNMYKLSYTLKYWYSSYDIIRFFLPFPSKTSFKQF